MARRNPRDDARITELTTDEGVTVSVTGNPRSPDFKIGDNNADTSVYFKDAEAVISALRRLLDNA